MRCESIIKAERLPRPDADDHNQVNNATENENVCRIGFFRMKHQPSQLHTGIVLEIPFLLLAAKNTSSLHTDNSYRHQYGDPNQNG